MSAQFGLPQNQVPGVDGIDVSAFQPKINYQKVYDAGYRFAWIRASVGPYQGNPGTRDPYRMIHYVGFKKTLLRPGFYHFFKPAYESLSQAQLFYDAAGGQRYQIGDLRPMCDFEVLDNLPIPYALERLAAFLDAADDLFETRLTLYSYASFFQNLTPSLSKISQAERDIILHPGRAIAQAKYDGTPVSVAPFADCSFFQFDGDEGRVEGVIGAGGEEVPCDRDRFRGTYDDLVRHCGEEPAALSSLSDDPRVVTS